MILCGIYYDLAFIYPWKSTEATVAMTGVGEALTTGSAQWQEGAAKKTQDINTFPMLREAVVRRINGSVMPSGTPSRHGSKLVQDVIEGGSMWSHETLHVLKQNARGNLVANAAMMCSMISPRPNGSSSTWREPIVEKGWQGKPTT